LDVVLRRSGGSEGGLSFRRRALRHPFEQRILDIKGRVRPEPFDWYRFDSFANLTQFERLIPGGIASVVQLAGDEPVVDIGVADGDLSFLLESLGCQVTAIDWPGTNANQMRGLELLHRELESRVEIREIDLDDQFRLDGDRYGLALALGLMYHLKNPFYFAEKLATHCRRALFSTRILPRGATSDAVARLASDREFENDPTNYWFFSEAGIERMLDRCGWEIAAKNITGDGVDDRYFCLAESRIAKKLPTVRLLDGWHSIENGAWRWTRRCFGAVLENPSNATRLELRFRIVPEILSTPLTLEAEVDGMPVAPEVYGTAGDQSYSRPLPSRSARHTVRFRLSQAFEADGRELGVIVVLPSRTIVDEDSGLRLVT
jgi:tRNA (mo5U34)-methyltransferase